MRSSGDGTRGIGRAAQYAIALAAVAAATLVRFSATPLIGLRAPFGPFFLGLSFGALLLDRGPAVFMWLASGVAAAAFFILPLEYDPARVAVETTYFSILGGAILAGGQLARGAIERAERARAETAATAARYRRLFDLSGIGFAIAEDRACERVRVNAWLADRLGIAADENAAIGPGRPRPYRVRRDGRDLDASELPLVVAARTGEEVVAAELELVAADGRRTDLLGYAAPVRRRGGTIAGAISAYVDITARKRAALEREQLLAAAERARDAAEAASRAKDAFLATVSHELRTPLSPILTWARLLENPSLSEHDRARGIATIARCAKMQAHLVEDLLDVSRIVAGKLRLELRPLAVAPVVEAALDVVRPTADAKGIEVRAELGATDCLVSADPDRLQQAVWNLLSNAIKFTPRGGRVRVVVARGDAHVRIAVSDTGRGIAPEFLPYLFDRFTQADSSVTRAYAGLGLGLAIVRHIVELHGGSVHAESGGLGAGSLFTIALPLLAESRAGEAASRRRIDADGSERRPDAPLQGTRALVVEDEPDVKATLVALLVANGADVRAAGSVDGAMRQIDGWTPDVVVTDIGMPEADGYALLARVRDLDGPVRDVPVVAVTAYAGTEERIRLLSAGFASHVSKPFDPDELVAVIASAVRDRR